MSKSVKVAENKSLQFRVDALDVLNHPEPVTPLVNINAANFGLITASAANPAAKSTLHRQFKVQLRFTF
jgi:hypothetical protein